MRQPNPFRWGLDLRREIGRSPNALCSKKPKNLGFAAGLHSIHDDKGAIAALSFASDERRTGFERALVEHAQSLRLIATFLHEHAKRFWTIDRMIGGVVLSPREYQCLEWSARGKSAGEIRIILGIAEPTAGFHLDNARAKLVSARFVKRSCG
ncbi:LuxR C-terminal-related transcriptional regulator [Bradyrhizobium sp. 160]|uniref:helix-turn-helix transcriptional regulator n=1 Tax=Bradyrhizobium sp. 160 TaxID=2782634 RepID=UPI001FF83BBD|nr:LuxR C-terminal-related transcriptional regulator [Bradyrhizobium sp. 160]